MSSPVSSSDLALSIDANANLMPVGIAVDINTP
jgi:hypothetical protein